MILEEFADADISVSIVWVDILKADSEEDAHRAADAMANDPRVRHFYDPAKRSATAISESLGWRFGTAWDIYLFYDEDAHWDAGAPRPDEWMHQLPYRVGDPHLRKGEALVEALRATMHTLTTESQ